MNTVHHTILDLLRRRTDADQNPLGAQLAAPDEEVVRLLFSNYRRGKGLHLSDIGLQLMKSYFKAYEIRTPEYHSVATAKGKQVRARHLVYLDGHVSLPYFCTIDSIVLFELSLGTKIKLADGDIQILIAMERNGTPDKRFLN